jgi:hypothetical protein
LALTSAPARVILPAMPLLSRLAAVTILLLAAGCARADWIESTLVTVDVTGDWTGEWRFPQFNGTLALTLRQQGSRVTGDARVTGLMDSKSDGAIQGEVSGDVIRLRQPHGTLQLDVIVNGDVMTGRGSVGKAGNDIVVELRRR